MIEKRHRHDAHFRADAVREVWETDKSIAQVARDQGISESTLCRWVARDLETGNTSDGRLRMSERAELLRLRKENTELAIERDVLKRSLVLWVREAATNERGSLPQLQAVEHVAPQRVSGRA